MSLTCQMLFVPIRTSRPVDSFCFSATNTIILFVHRFQHCEWFLLSLGCVRQRPAASRLWSGQCEVCSQAAWELVGFLPGRLGSSSDNWMELLHNKMQSVSGYWLASRKTLQIRLKIHLPIKTFLSLRKGPRSLNPVFCFFFSVLSLWLQTTNKWVWDQLRFRHPLS